MSGRTPGIAPAQRAASPGRFPSYDRQSLKCRGPLGYVPIPSARCSSGRRPFDAHLPGEPDPRRVSLTPPLFADRAQRPCLAPAALARGRATHCAAVATFLYAYYTAQHGGRAVVCCVDVLKESTRSCGGFRRISPDSLVWACSSPCSYVSPWARVRPKSGATHSSDTRITS